MDAGTPISALSVPNYQRGDQMSFQPRRICFLFLLEKFILVNCFRNKNRFELNRNFDALVVMTMIDQLILYLFIFFIGETTMPISFQERGRERGS